MRTIFNLASAKPFKTHKNKRKFLLEFRGRSGGRERWRLTDDLLIYDLMMHRANFIVSWLRMITFRLVLPLFVLSLPFLSRTKSTTTTTNKNKKLNMQEEDKENFGLWRREKHKNNDSFKLAVDDVAVVVCCALCGAFKAARHVIFGLRNCAAPKAREIT